MVGATTTADHTPVDDRLVRSPGRALSARLAYAAPMTRSSIDSRRSWLSKDSDLSILSIGADLSVGSAGSLLSIGSAGSILSIGSAGSILSIGSAGSILSFASAGSILSSKSAGSILSKRSVGSLVATDRVFTVGNAGDERSETDQPAAVVTRLATLVALAGFVAAVIDR